MDGKKNAAMQFTAVHHLDRPKVVKTHPVKFKRDKSNTEKGLTIPYLRQVDGKANAEMHFSAVHHLDRPKVVKTILVESRGGGGNLPRKRSYHKSTCNRLDGKANASMQFTAVHHLDRTKVV